MARAAEVIIDLNAIRHNYRLAQSCAPDSKVVAVVKADAYGHGAVQVAQALSPEADAFGVACIEEALILRNVAGVRNPVLLLEGFFSAEELPLICEYNFHTVIHSQWQIEMLLAAKLPKPIHVWLKLDAGMHRLGLSPEEYQSAWQRLSDASQVKQIVMMSHFSEADSEDKFVTEKQLNCFVKATEKLDSVTSLANSAAVMNLPDSHNQWIRPGIMLYGGSPFRHEHPVASQLKAAMTLRSEVIAERIVQTGESVGYGGLWQADKPTRIGTVAMGYGDGYPRHADTGTPVRINGYKSKVLGRVSMDMLAVDLSALPEESGVGAEVELWGEHISANDIARHAETIPYTLFCGITSRVKRRYINQ